MSQAGSLAPASRAQVLPWIVAIAASAAAVTLAVMHFKPLEGRNAQLDAAETAVKAVLKDPESAQFSGLWVGPGGKYVCGDVNAKNAMGGYVGKQSFLLQVGTGRVEFMPREGGSAAPLQQQLDVVQAQIKFLKDVETLCGAKPEGSGS